jgi:hypothetical protein
MESGEPKAAEAVAPKASFSRSANSCVFGKCTDEITKFLVPEIVRLDFERKFAASGYSSQGEYLRMMLLVNLYGKDTINTLQSDRVNSMVGIGDE